VADDIDSGYAIGADLRLKPLVLPIQLNAAAEYYLDVDAGNVYAFDANAVYVFGLATNAVFAPYAGGGIGLVTVSPDDGESDSDVGLNVVGGAQMLNVFPLVTPFVQAQASFGTEVNGADVNRVSLTGGLLFTL
jgi:opacity protein-like surface antigen